MDLAPLCPAALPLDGPAIGGPAVLCRVDQQEAERTDQIAHGESVSPLMTTAHDPSIVRNLCCGCGLPEDELPTDRPMHAHYTSCPSWRGDKERLWERRRMLREPKRRGNPEEVLDGFLADDPEDTSTPIEDWLEAEGV